MDATADAYMYAGVRMMSDMNLWSPLIAAASGLFGVWIGGSLTLRRDREERRLQFLRLQLEELYAPLYGIRLEIKAKSEFRVKVRAAGRRAGSDRAFEEFTRLILRLRRVGRWAGVEGGDLAPKRLPLLGESPFRGQVIGLVLVQLLKPFGRRGTPFPSAPDEEALVATDQRPTGQDRRHGANSWASTQRQAASESASRLVDRAPEPPHFAASPRCTRASRRAVRSPTTAQSRYNQSENEAKHAAGNLLVLPCFIG
jgi:hypothetical protein